MNIEAFVSELVETWREHHCCDVDGADLQGLLLKHGVCVERPATEEEAEQDWCLDFDIGTGDPIIADSPEFSAARRRVREAA